jgi:para-nitrobenzyl esterase
MAMQRPMTDGTYARVLRGLYPEGVYKNSARRGMSEDSLCLNVWSAELGSESRRPVMVWLHPGAFNSWAGYSSWTDGTRLARGQDVVVVSLNHRLNIFGHLYLGEVAGAKYAESGNVGMLDVVAALIWVRENIAAFGGDPENVTVFGESGGAAKVSVLMAMPTAKGLFHKAIVQSNSWNRAMEREEAAKSTLDVLARLQMKPAEVERLRQMPAGQLLEGWGDSVLYPVVAGESLPRHPFSPDAPGVSANVPMLIGTNKDDFSYLTLSDTPPRLGNAESVREVLAALLWKYGVDEAEAGRCIEAFRVMHSSASWREVFVGVSTAVLRDDATIQAERKVAQARAAVYMYRFNWESPAFAQDYGSMHTFEVPFVFDNVDAASQLMGSVVDSRAYELAGNLSRAWSTFAHGGNPGHRGLPHWEPYTVERRATMELNYTCELAYDPGREERLAFESLRASRLEKIVMWKRH